MMGTLTIPESMLIDRYLVYKYRVKRLYEKATDLPTSYEALEQPNQNRVLHFTRAADTRFSTRIGATEGRRKLLHFDDIIYPQQVSANFLTKIGSKVNQYFRPQLSLLGETFLANIFPSLRKQSLGRVWWMVSSLIGSFRERQLLSQESSPVKQKSSDVARAEMMDSLFEGAKKFVSYSF